MERLQFVRTTEYRTTESAAESIRLLVAAELLLHAAQGMLVSQFAGWTVSPPFYWALQGLLVLSVAFYGMIAPLFGKFRVIVSVAAELLLLLSGGWYGWKHIAPLSDGAKGLCGDYLLAWNAYYGTNFIVDSDGLQNSSALGFLLLVLVLLFLVLRCITGVRFLMLLPPLAALTLGLLVDRLPDWGSLAFLFVGVPALYSGPGRASWIVFEPIRQKKEKKAQFLAHIWSVVLVTVSALAIVFAAKWLFSAPAGHIPEYTSKFYAFQLRLEDWLLSLGNGVHIPSKRERPDNSTPQYRNEVILTITADQEPLTNLYLPEFYSGTYRNGSWEQESRAYRKETADGGIDGDRLGTLVRQMGYEYLTTVPIITSSGTEPMLRNYTIRYGKRQTKSAWVPYFADLTSLQDEVWVENEGLVRKKWSTDELSFVGWANNGDLDRWIGGMICLWEETDSGEDAIDWYSEYVQEHYLSGSELPAVQESAGEMDAKWSMWYGGSSVIVRDSDPETSVVTEGFGSETSIVTNDYGSELSLINVRRVAAARMVQDYLREHAVYNLYLDRLPAGTDTIQYFLETGREGYCMHFASAGVLILQELGIPARYASGYIVKRNAFLGGEDRGYSATVYDRNAHAWAEIYLEGIGWVPMEMTPGYETSFAQLPTDADRQEELQQKHEEKASEQVNTEETAPGKELPSEAPDEESETENSETEERTETAPGQQDGGTGSGAGAKVSWRLIAGAAAIVVSMLALLTLAAFLIRYGLRRYRGVLWTEIQRKQNRRAVQRINRRIFRRLTGGGVIPAGHVRLPGAGSGMTGARRLAVTDAEYEKRLVRAYPSVSPQDWARFMQIVKKAAFSGEPVDVQEVTFCYHIYETHRRRS